MGTERGITPSVKVNVETGHHLVYISFLLFFWFSVGCVYLRYSEYFQVILGFTFTIAIHIRI